MSASAGPLGPSSDPLGEALHSLRMNGAFYSRAQLTAPWGMSLAAMPDYMWFHVPASGVGVKDGRLYRQPNVLSSNTIRFVSPQHHVVDDPFSGAGPAPSSITDPLFEPVDGAELDQTILSQLGLSKPEFYAANQGTFKRVDVAC